MFDEKRRLRDLNPWSIGEYNSWVEQHEAKSTHTLKCARESADSLGNLLTVVAGIL